MNLLKSCLWVSAFSIAANFNIEASANSTKEILDYAVKNGWRGYTYPRARGPRGLVVATERGKSRIDFLKVHRANTISLV